MKKLITISFSLVCSLMLSAQTGKAVVHPYTLMGGNMSSMSDNGLWAISSGGSEDEGEAALPRLINVTTGEIIDLPLEKGQSSGHATDVTNDGKMISGSSEGYPAYYKNGTWTKLPMPAGTRGYSGEVACMTPDGRYMVGSCYSSGYIVKSGAWKDGELWDLPNLPTKDTFGQDQGQQQLRRISSDGKQILGILSYSYEHEGCCAFVYHTETSTYDMIGWDVLKTPEYSPSFVYDAFMSNNGRYVSGMVHRIKAVAGSDYPDEYKIPFLYDVQTKKFTLYEEEIDKDVATYAIGNDGTMFATTPAENPARTLIIRSGDYWINLDMVLKQKYDIDFTATTGFSLTGFALSVSDDVKTLGALSTSYLYCYTIQLPETWAEATKDVNLLADYTVSPTAKSSLAKIAKVNITFERAASIKENAQAFIYQGDTKVATSTGIASIADKTYEVTFPLTTLDVDKTYTIKIPAGCFFLGTSGMQNPDINIDYKGRAETPVKMIKSSPSDGSNVNELSYNNMLIMQFDTDLKITSGKSGYLYLKGNKEPISTLTLVAGGNQLYAYPLTKRMLMRGNEYVVGIPTGAVTDVTGFCPNDSITLNFVGKYTLSSRYAFFDDFTDESTSMAQYMRYDGDKRTPTEEMAKWNFDSENEPWNFSIRDDDSDDKCAASHSMYTPAGQSDDWMVLPPMQLTNEYFYLSFLAQSYKKASNDVLKIYALPTDADITMNAETAQRFRTEGKLIYEGRETPGTQENVLAGEWARHDVSLKDYKDQRIYIAFVNDNNNQSAIFVDSISVEYRGNYILGDLTEEIVAKQTSTPVKGYINVTGKNMTYTHLKAWYSDKDGTKLDELELNDLELKTDTFYHFTFKKELALTVGKTTEYKLSVVLDDEEQAISSSVKCIAFTPTRRIVIEEGTGDWCKNCPMGIITLEYLEEHFPDLIIPISIHNSDAYDFSAYLQYLGISAFPSGRVNRNSDKVLSPMYSGENDITYTSPNNNITFTDYTVRDLETLVEAEINLHDVKYNKEDNEIIAPVDVRFAVDIEDANYNMLTVIVEDSLIGNQLNGFVNYDLDIFGEWCGNGKYASSYVRIYYKDVARAIIGTSLNGESNLIPNTVKNNETVTNTLKFSVPKKIAELKNAKVICMLIDANTGKIINADRSYIANTGGWENAISNVSDGTEVEIGTADGCITVNGSSEKVAVYTLQGMQVRNEALQNGIYIFRTILPDGKVIAGKALIR